MPWLTRKHNAGKRKRASNSSAKIRQRKRYLATNATEWRAIRQRQLMRQPLCRHCSDKGIITLANEVDHINGRADRQQDYVKSNYQSLCKPCHSRKTREEQ